MPNGAVILPLTSNSGMVLYVQAQLNRTNLILIVDTGADFTLLDAALMAQHSIKAIAGKGTVRFVGGGQ